MTVLPPPPPALGAPVAALPPREELTLLLKSRRPPPPPPLPHLHLLHPLCHPPALSSHCPPCRRRGRARSQMSPYRLGLREKNFDLLLISLLYPQRQRCCLGGGVGLTCSPRRHSALGEQDKLVHTKLLKLIVQIFFFFFLLLQQSHFFTQNISGAFLCPLNCGRTNMFSPTYH